ncbi:MAG UNVERIFIED_CONTAM: hypothetical protein LVR29_31925 [Microcystis novacekii LVE1205-3]|jgi:hypothetical protein
MRYAVKHVYGISSTEYHSTLLEPLFGTGQGSGASPAIWLSLVTVLLNAYDQLADDYDIHGLAFNDPWQELSAKWHIGAFVDDTNQATLDSTSLLTTSELTEQLRQAGQLWENFSIYLEVLLICLSVVGRYNSGNGRMDDPACNLCLNTTPTPYDKWRQS